MIVSVSVFDPVERPTEDGNDHHLLYGDSKSFAALMQGVVDFTTFCGNGATSSEEDQHYVVTTKLHVIMMRRVEPRAVLVMVFGKEGRQSVFEKFYALYVLLHGSFEMQQQQGFPLRDTLDDFVPAFIACEVNTGETPGIKYAPVERHAFLAVHALGMELVSEYSPVKHFLVLWDGMLLATSVDPVQTAPLYQYLVVEGSGKVSNKKLTQPPYGRISTPAVLPGGGSSSFGRCIRQSGSKGYLFGTDDSGNFFCPLVYLREDNKLVSYYMCAYLMDGLMFVLLLDSTAKPENSLFTKLAHQLSSNLDIPRDLVPLIESDLKHDADDLDPSSVPFGFSYRNPLNASVMSVGMHEKAKISRLGKFQWNLNPFGGGPDKHASVPKSKRDGLQARLQALVDVDEDIVEVSVKTGSNEGWMHVARGTSGREILIDMHKDPKVPLWKALEEIDTFTSARFSTVFL